MTDEEKLILAKGGLYCALTGTEPIDLMRDLTNEWLDVVEQTLNFVETLKCSELTKELFVRKIINALLILKESIKIDLKECK